MCPSCGLPVDHRVHGGFGPCASLSDQISVTDQISDQGHAAPVHAPSKGLKGLPKPAHLEHYDRRQALAYWLEGLRGDQGDAARLAWQDILRINPNIALPTCGVTDEESYHDPDCAYLGWNPGPYTLDVSISPHGGVSWFFVDHHTGLTVTSDEQPGAGYLGFVGLFTRKEAGR